MSTIDPLVFQITSWYCCDLEYELDDDSDEEMIDPKYVIKVFGVNKTGQSISANLLNFTPYFYIKFPFSYNKATCERFRDFLCMKMPAPLRSSFLDVKLFKKKDFMGFHNGEKFNFLRFTFKSQAAWKAGIRVFQKSILVPGFPQCRYKLYESNIEPFLRMMHIRNIEPCGWVKINKFDRNVDILQTSCDIDVNASWGQIDPYECSDMAPMRIISFDIECISSHGDFPVAKKDYKKVANELFQYYSKNPDMTNLILELKRVFIPAENGLFSKVFPKYPVNLLEIEKKLKRTEDDIGNIIRGRMIFDQEKKAFRAVNGKISNDDMISSLTERLNSIGLPELLGDDIIQIGTTMHIYGEKQCSKRHIFSLGTCDPIEGVEVECCETEAEMLMRWRDLIVDKWNPDVITGYNIFGFDFSYMYERARELGIDGEFRKLGKISDEMCPYVEKNLSSSALGDNLLKFIDMNGRVLIDMMKVVQRDHKLDSYKLDNVAHHFMKMNKNDVSPNDIFRLYRGDSADRKTIAEYCVQDCALCNHLMIKLETLANNIGMSNVCYVPLAYIFMRGQSIKIFSLVAKQCREDEFLIPTLSKVFGEEEEDVDQEGYEGAIVLEPKCSIYLDDPVSVLDYASLYPSSMISENLSHDTLVMNEKYDNLPGVEYLDIRYDIYEGSGDKKVKVGEKVSRFVQFPNNEKGVLPRILMKLLRQRKETRKKIEFTSFTLKDGSIVSGLPKEKEGVIVVNGADGKPIAEVKREDVVEESETYNEFQKAVLDGLQLAYKVTANSLYGQCGAKTSPIYLKDVAASTTATGRKMIMLAKTYIEENCEGAEIVYGDSVTGYTPILIRQNNVIKIDTIEKLADLYGNGEWKLCIEDGKQEKEYCELKNVEVWSEDGWTKMFRVIRHILAEHKKIYRVNTHIGIVDVTDDHSLLRVDKTEVSPKSLMVGDKLLHAPYPKLYETSTHISVDEARIMGFFCGDGSCGRYYCKSGFKASWALNNSDIKLLQVYKELCEITYPELDWTILNTIESSHVYKLIPKSKTYGSVVQFVDKYRKALYYDNEKIIPVDILNASYDVRKAFWDGLYDADGDKEGIITRIDQKNQISMAMFQLLGDSLEYNTSINSRADKQNIYRLNLTKSYQRKDPNKIKKIYEIPYSGYVYDVTTENHHFQAGVGKLIVHNTDSIFVKFSNKDEAGNFLKGKSALAPSIQKAIAVSKEIKLLLKQPHDLEYEKTFYPFVLLSKKRYIANKYEFDDHKYKQASMGVVLKRRDNANIVKTIYGGIIDIILNDQNIGKSLKFLQDSMDNLVSGKYPVEELVITKSLKGDYKDPSKIAHKVLADRMKARDPGSAPQVNDRIPYVYVQTNEKKGEKMLQGDKIEHVDYVRKHKLKPDYNFYLTNQIMKPILQVYALVLENLPGFRKGNEYFKDLYQKILADKDGDVTKAKDRWQTLREEEVKKILFDPTLIKLENKKKGNMEITHFFKPIID
jgi:DNA polymerase elongation subunit (family B)